MEDVDYKKVIPEVKNYVKLQVEYAKLTASEKLSLILSKIAILAVLLLVGTCCLFYLASLLTIVLTNATGSPTAAYIIVFALLLLLVGVIIVFREPLIINPVTRYITRLFLKPDEDE